jgi:hypothetical protein
VASGRDLIVDWRLLQVERLQVQAYRMRFLFHFSDDPIQPEPDCLDFGASDIAFPVEKL